MNNNYVSCFLLKNAANMAIASAISLADQIDLSQEQAISVEANFSNIKAIMSDLDQLSSPSTNQTKTLAAEINSTIIPEDEVREVVKDANETLQKANEYLEAAVNARCVSCTE